MKVTILAKSDQALKEIKGHYGRQGLKKKMIYKKLGISEHFNNNILTVDFSEAQEKTKNKILKKTGVKVDYADKKAKQQMQIKFDEFKLTVHDQMRKAGVPKEEYEVHKIE